MMEDESGALSPAIDEIVQALRARAGYDVLYPEELKRKRIIEFVTRLTGTIPDAWDIVGTGVYFELARLLRTRTRDILKRSPSETAKYAFDWSKVTEHDILKSIENLAVSMGRGKGRKEGVDISRTVPIEAPKHRWSWRREP